MTGRLSLRFKRTKEGGIHLIPIKLLWKGEVYKEVISCFATGPHPKDNFWLHLFCGRLKAFLQVKMVTLL